MRRVPAPGARGPKRAVERSDSRAEQSKSGASVPDRLIGTSRADELDGLGGNDRLAGAWRHWSDGGY
jgi:hypothetical protein